MAFLAALWALLAFLLALQQPVLACGAENLGLGSSNQPPPMVIAVIAVIAAMAVVSRGLVFPVLQGTGFFGSSLIPA